MSARGFRAGRTQCVTFGCLRAIRSRSTIIGVVDLIAILGHD
jgi:hypothetical protein